MNGLTHSSQLIRRRTGAGGGLDEYHRLGADGWKAAAAQPASLEGQEVRLSPRGACVLAIVAAAALACSRHQAEPDEYIGKVVLVGVSLSRPDGSGTRQLEVHGTVKEVDPEVGIVISVSEPTGFIFLRC